MSLQKSIHIKYSNELLWVTNIGLTNRFTRTSQIGFELQIMGFQEITITSQTGFESWLFNVTNHFEKISQWLREQVLLNDL